MWKKLIAVLALAAVFALVVALALQREPQRPPLPSPNGYDDFAKAGGLLVENSHKWADLDVSSLRQLVESNRPALNLVRSGLEKECVVPSYSLTNETHIALLGSLKALAHGFLAEARLAALQGRTNDAANAALDCFRFGAECSRGGLLIDHMVDIAIQNIALTQLNKFQESLDAQTLRRMAEVMEQTDGKQENLDVIFERDHSHAGMYGRIIWMILGNDKKQRKAMTQKHQAFLLLLRNEEMSFAGRAYELQKGHPPASAQDLIPEYLKTVPLHPGTGAPMK